MWLMPIDAAVCQYVVVAQLGESLIFLSLNLIQIFDFRHPAKILEDHTHVCAFAGHTLVVTLDILRQYATD